MRRSREFCHHCVVEHQATAKFEVWIIMKQKSMLLVDDEKLVLNSLFRELASDELEVTLAANGEEAVDMINTGQFDIVVTDMMMPGLDGFQVLKAAKKRDARTMVIILTGYGDMDSAVDALRLGADDFLQKPCDPGELQYRISNCLVKQEMERKIFLYENILPVCCYCRKIRDDRPGERGEGAWYTLEEYFNKASGVSVSHGICPDCYIEQKNTFTL
jgi:CheY-like chemotaxis protein